MLCELRAASRHVEHVFLSSKRLFLGGDRIAVCRSSLVEIVYWLLRCNGFGLIGLGFADSDTVSIYRICHIADLGSDAIPASRGRGAGTWRDGIYFHDSQHLHHTSHSAHMPLARGAKPKGSRARAHARCNKHHQGPSCSKRCLSFMKEDAREVSTRSENDSSSAACSSVVSVRLIW